ncbi:hypothetical protein Vadar_026729 [Vaccinium darrowii]|uniref:Uncharacterized protein n=1 Tax=Vaccinium darrowii TaxID=229202 RepID=A0ACB7Z7T5_9ERIC|nr:hypothetical protein Vadar_026729 [Vaccinium darrowii]
MGAGKKKIEIKMREKGEQRMVTFSKRRQGLFKKAHQLHCLTGAHIASIVFSPAGWPFVHGDPSFDATIDRYLKINHTNSSISGGGGAGAASSSTSCVEEEMVNGGDDDGVEANKRMMMLRSCLDGLRVDDFWKVEELVEMKEKMEVIRGKVVEQIEKEVVKSYLCPYY